MQNTRLNNLVDSIVGQLRQWLSNPWRRLSVLALSLLLGFFLGSVLSTVAGQAAQWDVTVAGFTVLLTEIMSRFFYGSNQGRQRSLWASALNWLKIGLTYSLFLEAFKLGS